MDLINNIIAFSVSTLLSVWASFSPLPHAATYPETTVEVPASCPRAGVAPRTIFAPASTYANSNKFSLDKEGILVFNYGAAYNNLGKFRNPFFVSNYALALYRDWLHSDCRDENLKSQFLTQAEWLMREAKPRDDMMVWTYPFENRAFRIPAPYISGIGQSRIAGVLIRAYEITGEERFKKNADAAIRTYLTPVKKGGVITREGNAVWIEEAVDPDGTSFKILNGHITASAGLLDYYSITHEKPLYDLFEATIRAVKRDLPKFDAGFTSYYSIHRPGDTRNVAPLNDYNSQHISQLLWLYDHEPNPLFLKYAMRFQTYELNKDQYTAKGSVDPINHGPDKARGRYGSSYWSHSAFPTWIQVNIPSRESISGVAIDAGSPKATPRAFRVSSWDGEKWLQRYATTGNTKLAKTVMFDKPVITDKLRIDIESDNGNKNVALRAVMPLRTTPPDSTITNECNFRAKAVDGVQSFNQLGALDGNAETVMQVHCPGWVILPTNEATRLAITATGKSKSVFKISASSDLDQWTGLGTIGLVGTQVLPAKTKYVRIEFDTGVKQIQHLELRQGAIAPF